MEQREKIFRRVAVAMTRRTRDRAFLGKLAGWSLAGGTALLLGVPCVEWVYAQNPDFGSLAARYLGKDLLQTIASGIYLGSNLFLTARGRFREGFTGGLIGNALVAYDNVVNRGLWDVLPGMALSSIGNLFFMAQASLTRRFGDHPDFLPRHTLGRPERTGALIIGGASALLLGTAWAGANMPLAAASLLWIVGSVFTARAVSLPPSPSVRPDSAMPSAPSFSPPLPPRRSPSPRPNPSRVPYRDSPTRGPCPRPSYRPSGTTLH